MIADALKKALLQAAIQGKLTEQLPEDGDARDLLKEIQKEKARLVKEGKIKKEKSLPEIKEEEIPFEIPESWVWVRLGDITFNRGQKKPSEKFTYVDISSINNSKNTLGDLSNILSPKEAPSRARKIVQEGDVIYATVRPYLHNTCLIDRSIKPEPIVSTGFAVVTSTNLVINKFLFRCFLSPMFDEYANSNDNSKGVAYPAINDQKFTRALIPLPPLSEQNRIVKKIEELLPEIEALKEEENKLDNIEKAFPGKIRASILQAAIQGKLTEQLPEDGDARDLLKEIQKEKARLIKEGKIKKEKPLLEITEDEIPFDIPENWVWCRLAECNEMMTGNSIPKDVKAKKYSTHRDGLPYIGTKDVSANYEIDYENGVYIPLHEPCFKKANKNSTLLCVEGGSAGRKIAMTDREVCFGNKLCKFEAWKINPKYVFYYLQTNEFGKLFKGEVTGIIGGVGIDRLKNIPICLPPLAEQIRIVEKLEDLLPLCDRLE